MKTLRAGPETATTTLILLHGRGATAQSMMPLYAELGLPNVRVLAPQAPGNSWYPYRFLAPLEQNRAHLEQALQLVDDAIGQTPSQQVALLGFSQGACLALEYAARNPRRYAAVMALTGGLITLQHSGDLQGTPFFLGSGDPDAHVPFSRVEESAGLLRVMNAQVEARRYPGMAHTINDDQINYCRGLLTPTKGTQL